MSRGGSEPPGPCTGWLKIRHTIALWPPCAVRFLFLYSQLLLPDHTGPRISRWDKDLESGIEEVRYIRVPDCTKHTVNCFCGTEILGPECVNSGVTESDIRIIDCIYCTLCAWLYTWWKTPFYQFPAVSPKTFAQVFFQGYSAAFCNFFKNANFYSISRTTSPLSGWLQKRKPTKFWKRRSRSR